LLKVALKHQKSKSNKISIFFIVTFLYIYFY
jgi:hypothetical protein